MARATNQAVDVKTVIHTDRGSVSLPFVYDFSSPKGVIAVAGATAVAFAMFCILIWEPYEQFTSIFVGVSGAFFIVVAIVSGFVAGSILILDENGITRRTLGFKTGSLRWEEIACIRVEQAFDIVNRGLGFRQITNPDLVERVLFVEPVGRPGSWFRPPFSESEDDFEGVRHVLNHFANVGQLRFRVKSREGVDEVGQLSKGDYRKERMAQEWT